MKRDGVGDGQVCELPPCAHENIDIFWEQDNAWYPARVIGVVGTFHNIRYYDDGAVEKEQLRPGAWRPSVTPEEGVDMSKETSMSFDESLVGMEVEIYWSDDNAWWGSVPSFTLLHSL